MTLIKNAKSLAARIVNAVCADLYGRSGGDYWFDGIDEDVLNEEVIPELVAAVQRQLDVPQRSVTRFEVIDETGRVYTRQSSVTLSYQDDGRTLKVFVPAWRLVQPPPEP